MNLYYRSELESNLKQKGLGPTQIDTLWTGMEHLAKHTGGKASASHDYLLIPEEVVKQILHVLH